MEDLVISIYLYSGKDREEIKGIREHLLSIFTYPENFKGATAIGINLTCGNCAGLVVSVPWMLDSFVRLKNLTIHRLGETRRIKTLKAVM